jgi:hypothetical protein
VISDYATLQAAIGNWLNRADLSARIPEFIVLAEARLNRKLEDVEQDTIVSVTITDGVGTLPSDFGGLIAIDGDFNDDPIIYNIAGGQIQTDPAVTGPVTLEYRKAIPALADDNATNWLLDRAPDIYLYASLLQAEFFGWNDERLPTIKSGLDEAIAELMIDSEKRRWGRAPVAPQIGRT